MGPSVTVSVQDEGTGLDANAISHAFDKFFQTETGTREGGIRIGSIHQQADCAAARGNNHSQFCGEQWLCIFLHLAEIAITSFTEEIGMKDFL